MDERWVAGLVEDDLRRHHVKLKEDSQGKNFFAAGERRAQRKTQSVFSAFNSYPPFSATKNNINRLWRQALTTHH